MKKKVFLFVFITSSIFLQAQDITFWNGGKSNDWNDPENWSLNAVPDENTVVVIEEESPNFPDISEGTNAVCASISNSGYLEISGGSLSCNSYSQIGGSTNIFSGDLKVNGDVSLQFNGIIMVGDTSSSESLFECENYRQYYGGGQLRVGFNGKVKVNGVADIEGDNQVKINGGTENSAKMLKLDGTLELDGGDFFASNGVNSGENSVVSLINNESNFHFSGDEGEDFFCNGQVKIDAGILFSSNNRTLVGGPKSSVSVTGGILSVEKIDSQGKVDINGGEAYVQDTAIDDTLKVLNGMLGVYGSLTVNHGGFLSLEGGSTQMHGPDGSVVQNNGTIEVTGGLSNWQNDVYNNNNFFIFDPDTGNLKSKFGEGFYELKAAIVRFEKVIINNGTFNQSGGTAQFVDDFQNDNRLNLFSGSLNAANIFNNGILFRGENHELDLVGEIVNNGALENQISKDVGDGETTVFDLDGENFLELTAQNTGLGATSVTFGRGTTCPPNAFGSGCPPAPRSIKRYFDITPAQNELASIKFYFLNDELNGQIHGGDLKLFNYDIENNVWRKAGYFDEEEWIDAVLAEFGGSGTIGDPYYAEFTGVGSFSPFVLSSAESPQSVEFISFSGELNDDHVFLNWQTSAEIDNVGFDVERSTEEFPNVWETLGFVEGNGTSTVVNQYSFVDDNLPEADVLIYRLKQIDLSGTFVYTSSIMVDITTSVDDEVIKNYKFVLEQNYPNPFNPSTTIKFTIPRVLDAKFASTTTTKLVVYDILGREVATLINESLQPGVYEVNFDARNLSSGIYIYCLIAGDKYRSNKKMTLIK